MAIFEVVATVSAGLVGSIGGYEYRRHREKDREQKDTIKTWFDDSLDIIGRGAYNIEQARFGSNTDYERILTELDSFSERLFVQVRDPPDEVPDSTIEVLSEVAKLYAKATAVADVNTRKEGSEVILELFEMAQEEYREEVDFEDALNEAAELSDGFEQMVRMMESHGTEPSEFAEAMGMIFTQWDSEDFEMFLMGANGQGGDVEQTIEQVMGLFFTLAIALSNKAYTELQNEREQVTS